MLNLLIQLILTALSPVVAFLKSVGLWDDLVRLYDVVHPVFSNIFSWIGDHIGFQNITDFLISFAKLVINIFIVLFEIIVKGVSWVAGLFG